MLPTPQQWRRWSLPSKYGLIGVVLTFVGLAGSVFFWIVPFSQTESPKPDLPRISYFPAIYELASNDWGYSQCLVGKKCKLTRISYDETGKLLRQHYDQVLESSYGEENTIMDLYQQLSDERASARRIGERKFRNLFLIWYIDLKGERLSWKEREALPTALFPVLDCQTDAHVYIEMDGRIVNCMSDYLGYMD